RDELTDYGDELTAWVEENVPAEFFASSATAEVADAYTQLVQWVQGQAQFLPLAKAEFAQKPDAWVIAYAKAYGYSVVTHEVLAPDVRKRVPIPNVCV